MPDIAIKTKQSSRNTPFKRLWDGHICKVLTLVNIRRYQNVGGRRAVLAAGVPIGFAGLIFS